MFQLDAKIEQALRLYRDLPGAQAWRAEVVGAATS
jgi:hypothetical protein